MTSDALANVRSWGTLGRSSYRPPEIRANMKLTLDTRLTTMHRVLATMVLVFAVGVGCSPDSRPSSAAPRCGFDPAVALQDSAAGAFRLGESAASVLSRCPAVQDTVVTAPSGGDDDRTLIVRMDGDSAYLAVAGDSVYMIRVFSSRFRTAEGFGPGAPIRPLLLAAGATATRLHTNVLKIQRYCSLTFHFDEWSGDEEFGTTLSAGHLLLWTSSPTVTEVVIGRCYGAA